MKIGWCSRERTKNVYYNRQAHEVHYQVNYCLTMHSLKRPSLPQSENVHRSVKMLTGGVPGLGGIDGREDCPSPFSTMVL